MDAPYMMSLLKLAFSKAEIQSELAERFGSAFKLREKPAAEVMATGIPEVDRITGGLPRGAVTEILGPASSGRTSLLHSVLSASTICQEVCALVDASDSFDATSAANAGVDFCQLLWIRCASNVEHAIKATDLLLQSGGFGLVALDLGDVPPQQSRRIQLSWWFRFSRAIENTPTALLVISRDPNARSNASLVLEMNRASAKWLRPSASLDLEEHVLPARANLLGGFRLHVERCKPMCLDEREANFEAKACWRG
jgi:recombination protein RecA